MLKSCTYCGKIHDSKYDCGMQPQKYYKKTDKDKYRWTNEWKKLRESIKKRDNYLCQVCLLNKYETIRRLNSIDLEVHHIERLNDNYDKRADRKNLITLCKFHHRMADIGEIPAVELLDITLKKE